jgi:hypothetical protein
MVSLNRLCDRAPRGAGCPARSGAAVLLAGVAFVSSFPAAEANGGAESGEIVRGVSADFVGSRSVGLVWEAEADDVSGLRSSIVTYGAPPRSVRSQRLGVSCAAWTQPLARAAYVPESGNFARHPAVRADGSGRLFAAWFCRASRDQRLQVSVRPPGRRTAFGGPRTLSWASRETRPEVATAAAGRAVVVWRTDNVSTSTVQAAFRPRGARASFGRAINVVGDDRYMIDPRVAMDARGNTIVVWLRYTGARRRTSDGYSRYAPDGQWVVEAAFRGAGSRARFGEPRQLSTNDGGAANPALAFGARGAVVVWDQVDRAPLRSPANANSGAPVVSEAPAQPKATPGSRVTSFAAVLPDGRPDRAGTAVPLSAPSERLTHPRVAYAGRGGAVVIWRQTKSTQVFVLSRHVGLDGQASSRTERVSSALPLGPTYPSDRLSTNERYAGISYDTFSRPNLAADRSGNTVAVWSRLKRGAPGDFLEYATRRAGRRSAFRRPALIPGARAASQRVLPIVTVSSRGLALIAWADASTDALTGPIRYRFLEADF